MARGRERGRCSLCGHPTGKSVVEKSLHRLSKFPKNQEFGLDHGLLQSAESDVRQQHGGRAKGRGGKEWGLIYSMHQVGPPSAFLPPWQTQQHLPAHPPALVSIQ